MSADQRDYDLDLVVQLCVVEWQWNEPRKGIFHSILHMATMSFHEPTGHPSHLLTVQFHCNYLILKTNSRCGCKHLFDRSPDTDFAVWYPRGWRLNNITPHKPIWWPWLTFGLWVGTGVDIQAPSCSLKPQVASPYLLPLKWTHRKC